MEPAEYETLESLEDRFWWYRGLHQLVLQTLEEPLQQLGRVSQPVREKRPLHILDAGCGTGGLMKKLGVQHTVSGIDFSPHAVSRASRKTGRPVSRASVEALPFPDNRFDALVSLDVLYHLGVEDDRQALEEFQRVVRPGGYVLLNLPAYDSLRSSHDTAIHTARRYERDAFAKLLREAGLEPVKLTYWNTILFPALAFVRWMRRDSDESSKNASSDVRPVPAWIDRTLGAVLALERSWLRHFRFPFGLSLLSLARVPEPKRVRIGD